MPLLEPRGNCRSCDLCGGFAATTGAPATVANEMCFCGHPYFSHLLLTTNTPPTQAAPMAAPIPDTPPPSISTGHLTAHRNSTVTAPGGASISVPGLAGPPAPADRTRDTASAPPIVQGFVMPSQASQQTAQVDRSVSIRRIQASNANRSQQAGGSSEGSWSSSQSTNTQNTLKLLVILWPFEVRRNPELGLERMI